MMIYGAPHFWWDLYLEVMCHLLFEVRGNLLLGFADFAYFQFSQTVSRKVEKGLLNVVQF